MMLLFYDVTWCCDHDCDMSVLCDNCCTLSHHLVPSIFKSRGKKKRKKQDRKSLSKKYKNFIQETRIEKE